MGILCLNFETESVPSIIQLELNRGSTRANTGTRGSRASSDISEEKSHKKGLIRFKICMMIYTQHSTAQFNFGLPVCQTHFTNTNVWCFHFSVFVSVSEKLETEWSTVLFSENIAFFFSFLIILVFGVWALWKKVPF